MLNLAIFYIVISLTVLVVLSGMIVKIGPLIGGCPDSKRAAKVGSVTVATGFAAIGAGGVVLIGAALPLLQEAPIASLMVALGLAALCLGLGFAHAVATLRAIVMDVAPNKAA